MPEFESPTDLKHNRGLIADPEAFAHEAHAGKTLERGPSPVRNPPGQD